jgi:hypothetical protein
MNNSPVFPTLEEYLTLLPAEVLFKHFLARFGQKRRILSSSLIKDAAKHIASEKSLSARFKGLSREARLTCGLAYLFGKRGVPAPGLRSFDDELLSSFLVFAGRDGGGKTCYYPFEEFEVKLLPLCAGVLVETAKIEGPGEPAPVPQWYCLSDVIICANLASLGMIEKTKKGTFSKAADAAFKRFLHAAHELPQVEGREDIFAACVSLLLGYAVSRELLALDDGAYRANPQNMLAWLALPLDGRYADFCEFAFESVPLWRRPVLEKIFELPGRTWLSTHALPDPVRKDAAAEVSLLGYCGYCDACKGERGLLFSRAARRDAAALAHELPAGRITLMPDFSAVLSQEVLPEDLFWFLRVGALVSFDMVYKGAIRRDIINNALSEGTNEKKLVEWLVSWNAPHNVVETVKEWIREFSRIYLTTNTTVMSFDEKATRQLKAYGPLAELVTPEHPHAVFTIRRGREQEVKSILAAMGFDPRKPGESAFEKRRAAIEAVPEAAPAVTPLVSFEANDAGPVRRVRAGKYGEKLKELDMSDLIHVVDYAVLMGKALTVEYLGSPYVKKGAYTVSPLAVHKAGEPFFEAEAKAGKSKRKFLLKKIKRIGVESA